MNQEELVKMFKALANDNRLRILEAIKNSPARSSYSPESIGLFELKEEGICCVHEIVEQFDMGQSTISEHLKELHNAGLLERHKKAKRVYYTVNHKRLAELAEYLKQFTSLPARVRQHHLPTVAELAEYVEQSASD